MGFAGFRPGAFAFLRDLAANQTKAWYEANKPAYEAQIRQPLSALVEALAARLAADGIGLTGDARRSLFRINRDVRFSANKSPYKTHAAAVWFRPGSGKDGAGILYFHLADEGCFTAAAFYHPEREVLDSIREGIRVRPDSFLAMTETLAAAGLVLDEAESLKRMPHGFEDLAGSPVAPFLRMRNLVVQRHLTRQQLATAGLVGTLAGFARDAMPLLEFGWRAVDEVAHA